MKWKVAVIAGVATALALSACGSAKNDNKSSGESPAPTNKAELGTLKLVESQQYAISLWGADVAQELGMWPDGLSVDISVGEKGVEIMAAGQADLAITSPNRFIGAIKNGLEATIVGPTVEVTPLYLAVRANSPATKMSELSKGTKFGISSFGSTGHYATVKVAESLGWKESDYQLVKLGGLPEIQAGIKSGAVDAFLWSSVPVYTMEAQGQAKVLGSVEQAMGANPGDVIVASNAAIKRNSAAVRAFCEGFYKANQRMIDNPDQATELLKKWGVSESVIPIALKTQLPQTSTDASLTDEQIAGMADATRFTIESAKDVSDKDVKGMYRSCDSL